MARKPVRPVVPEKPVRRGAAVPIPAGGRPEGYGHAHDGCDGELAGRSHYRSTRQHVGGREQTISPPGARSFERLFGNGSADFTQEPRSREYHRHERIELGVGGGAMRIANTGGFMDPRAGAVRESVKGG